MNTVHVYMSTLRQWSESLTVCAQRTAERDDNARGDKT